MPRIVFDEDDHGEQFDHDMERQVMVRRMARLARDHGFNIQSMELKENHWQRDVTRWFGEE